MFMAMAIDGPPAMVVAKREDRTLTAPQNLNSFLAGVEKRAYRMAQVATSQSEDALDIVQDAMLTLASRYANRDPAEWGPLFHRILQNRIRDWYRRQKVKNRLMSWFRFDDEEDDPVEAAADPTGKGPLQSLQHEDMGQALQQALQALPLRQQQTFLLRAWEGLDVAQTASAMGISSGSVKTHYSRAVQALRQRLGDYEHAQ